MNYSYYDEQERNVINGILETARNLGLTAEFSEVSSAYDNIVITKPTGDELGRINIQSNTGTTFTDPKEIVKRVIYADNSNPLGQNYLLDGIIERGKQYGRKLTYEEQFDKIADSIWGENKGKLKERFLDGDFEGDYGEFSELTENEADNLLIYTDDCRGIMDEAMGAHTNLDYDEDEYDGLEGGRDHRDTVCASCIAERYLVSKLEEKFEAVRGDWEKELESKSPKGPGE